jgi:NAD(P)-dependent dehydrogenase (short-subunit alcohol dehydrogenase family)
LLFSIFKVQNFGFSAFSMNKFSLEGMSQTWASELQESGVRANWVDPAWIAFLCSAQDS